VKNSKHTQGLSFIRNVESLPARTQPAPSLQVQSRRAALRGVAMTAAAAVARPLLAGQPTAAAASGVATAASAAVASSDEAAGNPLCIFTKPFNSLSAGQIGERCAALGFQGLEAPIRKGGHIEPEAVADQLPAFVEALQQHQQQILVLTSDVNDPRDPVNRRVLQTASDLGVKYYRLKYFRYDESRPLLGQIDEWARQLKELAELNRELGITGVYQNHAGRGYFGAAIWDLQRALQEIDPQHLGVAFDIRHATAEAGMNWAINFGVIQPHVRVVYVKDFQWQDGQSRPVNVPLGEGRVDHSFFRMLAATGFRGPISLHEEYLDHRDPALVEQHWQAIAGDMTTLKSWLQHG